MAKKSFKSGLDNLLASAGIKKKIVTKEAADIQKNDNLPKKEISDDEKYWLILKIERLEKELALWRNGKLSSEEFQNSIKKYGLRYNSGTNEIIEI